MPGSPGAKPQIVSPAITKAQIIAIAGPPGPRGFRGPRGNRGPRGRHGRTGRPGLAAIVGYDGKVQWISADKARWMVFSGMGKRPPGSMPAVKSMTLRGVPIQLSGPRMDPKPAKLDESVKIFKDFSKLTIICYSQQN